ncbi:brain-specific serine protease 4-like [Manis pentadactyla]|uniref:brain-specific serine protease 4-like n=1 Tax=Manis pentadactyla TaxID=143292 RepID=UPI00255CC03A|nr:brain-specific serine protease 4-like [Manis pentadactyla]
MGHLASSPPVSPTWAAGMSRPQTSAFGQCRPRLWGLITFTSPPRAPSFQAVGTSLCPPPKSVSRPGLDRWGRARTRSLGPEPQRQSSGSTDPGRRWGSQLEPPVPVTAHFLPTAPPTPVTDSPGGGARATHSGDCSDGIPPAGIKPGGGCSRRAHSRRPPHASVASRMPPALGGSGFRILTSLLLLAAPATLDAAKTPAPPACGKPQRLSRVVGGEDSADAEWPWVVSIQRNGTHHCAGSLLTSRWAVTAAHCFKGNLNKPSQFSVLLGAWQLGNPGQRSQTVGVAWVQPHPVYSWRGGSRADIALVRLEHSVQFSERILPVCLPDSSVHLPRSTDCWIAGWGSVRDGVPLPQPQTLQKLKVPIIDSELCGRLYWQGAGQGVITEDMLCAGYVEGERDACLGDSGGPLMCQVGGTWLLAGIISWGDGCAERNRPGVYISLAAHRSWVQRIVPGVQLRGHSQGSGPTARPGRVPGTARQRRR